MTAHPLIRALLALMGIQVRMARIFNAFATFDFFAGPIINKFRDRIETLLAMARCRLQFGINL